MFAPQHIHLNLKLISSLQEAQMNINGRKPYITWGIVFIFRKLGHRTKCKIPSFFQGAKEEGGRRQTLRGRMLYKIKKSLVDK